MRITLDFTNQNEALLVEIFQEMYGESWKRVFKGMLVDCLLVHHPLLDADLTRLQDFDAAKRTLHFK